MFVKNPSEFPGQLSQDLENAKEKTCQSSSVEELHAYVQGITEEFREAIEEIGTGMETIIQHVSELEDYSNSQTQDSVNTGEMIQKKVQSIYEAACFHDLSSQRLTKAGRLLENFFNVVARVERDCHPHFGELIKTTVIPGTETLQGPQPAKSAMQQSTVDDLFE